MFCQQLKDNMALLIGEAKYKLACVSEDSSLLFGCKIPKHVIEQIEQRFSPRQLFHAYHTCS